MPEVDLFLGTGEFQNISAHIDKMINGQVNERMLNSSSTFLMNDKSSSSSDISREQFIY